MLPPHILAHNTHTRNSALFIHNTTQNLRYVHDSQDLRVSPRERLRLGDVADFHEIVRKEPHRACGRQGPHVRYDQRVDSVVGGLAVGDVEPSRVSRTRGPDDDRRRVDLILSVHHRCIRPGDQSFICFWFSWVLFQEV
jgi:hypothetical protein